MQKTNEGKKVLLISKKRRNDKVRSGSGRTRKKKEDDDETGRERITRQEERECRDKRRENVETRGDRI